MKIRNELIIGDVKSDKSRYLIEKLQDFYADQNILYISEETHEEVLSKIKLFLYNGEDDIKASIVLSNDVNILFSSSEIHTITRKSYNTNDFERSYSIEHFDTIIIDLNSSHQEIENFLIRLKNRVLIFTMPNLQFMSAVSKKPSFITYFDKIVNLSSTSEIIKTFDSWLNSFDNLFYLNMNSIYLKEFIEEYTDKDYSLIELKLFEYYMSDITVEEAYDTLDLLGKFVISDKNFLASKANLEYPNWEVKFKFIFEFMIEKNMHTILDNINLQEYYDRGENIRNVMYALSGL